MGIRNALAAGVSTIALVCTGLSWSTTSATAQGLNEFRWQPRGEIGGYGGDSALTRGEVGLLVPLYQTGDALLFGDLRGRFFDGGASEGNLALGYRRSLGDDRIFGVWFGYDGRSSALGNYFDQVSGGIEVLHPDWEFRLNGYLPLTDKKTVSSSTVATGGVSTTPTLSFVGSQLFLTSGGGTTTTTKSELALYGMDVEFGIRVPLTGGGAAVSRRGGGRGLPKHDLRLYGGAYYFDHPDFAGEIAGLRARAEWRVNDLFRSLPGSYAAFEVGYQYDDVRDGLFHAGARINIPLGKRADTAPPDQYDALMTGFIQRDPNIVTREVTTSRSTGTVFITEPVNDALTGTALDRTLFLGSGDLQSEITAAGSNSHLVITDGAGFSGAFVLPDDVTLQGAGTDLTVIGRTSGLTAVYAEPGATPTLSYSGTAASGSPNLTVGSNTHVLGFNIVGSQAAVPVVPAAYALVGPTRPNNDGILGNGAVSNVVIERVNVRDTGGDGIDFRAGGNRINISNVTVNRAHGDGIALGLNNSTVDLANFSVMNAQGNGVSVTGISGDASLLGFTNVSIDGSMGTGIDLVGTGGTFTFANTDISGSGNKGLSVFGGTTGLTFDAASSIIHASDGAAVDIDGSGTPNTGSLSFGGTIEATAGLGLQFDNADGTYDFSGQVTLNGGDAGIDILGGSNGTFTFANTDITNPTGTAFNVNTTNAIVNHTGGSISQNNAAALVDLSGTTNSSFTFGPLVTMTATNGTGIQINNVSGGVATFAGPVTLNGGDAGIDIIGTTGSALEFSDASISDPTGTAFNLMNVDDSAISVTGPITQNNAATAVMIDGFTDSVLAIQDPVTANTGAADGVHLNNVTGSTITIAGADIDTTTGTGFVATGFDNSSLSVGATSIDTTNGQAIDVAAVGSTDVTMLLTSVSSQNSATSGMSFNNIDPATIVAQNVDIGNSAGAGIDIVDTTGAFAFDSVSITNPGGPAIAVTGGDATVNVNGGTITQSNNQTTVGVTNHTGGTVSIGADINATNGDGLQFTNADGTYDFTGQVTLNGGDAGIDILGGSAGTFTFANTDVTDPTGVGLNIADNSANVAFGQDSSITQGNNASAIQVTNQMGGGLTFEGALDVTNGDGLQFVNADGTNTLTPLGSNLFVLDGTGNAADTGIDILGGSDGTFTFTGTLADPIQITNDQGVAVNVADSPGTVNLNDVAVNQSNGAGIQAANSGTLNIFGGIIDNTVGDGVNVLNTNLRIDTTRIGETGLILGDGIEIQNTDGVDRTADLIFNNIFGLGSPDPTGRGVFINALSGTLTADLTANFISTDQSTIQTRDGGSAGNLIISMTGNSTLTTNGAFPTMDITGSGLNSTIVREWEFPNQVIGGSPSSSGILFDQVTFDADGNPGNGFQQVVFDDGALDIGSVPPFTIQRVEGNGLTFLDTTGDLRIETLNIANQNGTGLLVDTKGLGTTFNLDIGGGTIDTIGGPAVFLDPLTGDITLDSVNAPGGLIFDEFIGTFNVSDGSIALTTGGTLALDGAPDVTIMNMDFAGADGVDGGPGVDGTNGETAITVNNTTLTLDNVTAIGGKGGSGGDATGANDAGDAGLAGDGIRIDANSTVNVTNGSQITGGDAGDGGNSDTGTPGEVLFNAAGNGILALNGGNTISVTDSTVVGGTSGVHGLNAAEEPKFFGSTLGGEGIELDDDATLQVIDSTISGGAARNTTGFASISSGGDGIFVPNGFDSGGVDPTNVFNITIDNSTVSAGPGVAGTATLNAGVGGPSAIDIFESNLTLNIINNSMILGADGVVDPRRSDPGFLFGSLPSFRNAVKGTTALGTFAAGTINIVDSTVRGGTGGNATATVGAGNGGSAIAILETSDTPAALTVNITDSTVQGGDAGDGGQDLIIRVGSTLEPDDGGGEAIVAFSGTNAQVFNINNSTIQGGNGSTQTGIYGPTMGGNGFETREGNTTTLNVNTGTTISAGDGGDGTGANDGADGGIGVRIAGGTVNFNAGSTTTGGDGGDATGTGSGGDGGLGVDASAGFAPIGPGTVNNNGGTVTNGTDGTP